MLIWLLADSDTGKFTAFKNLLAAFSAHHPDAKADFRVMTRKSMWDGLFAHLRDSKRTPIADIVEIPHSWTAMFAGLGLLAEVGSIFEGFNLSRYPEFVRPGCVSGGSENVFSVPWWMQASAIFYKPEEFKKHGLEPGDALVEWDSLLETCGKIARKKRQRGFYPVLPFDSRGFVTAADALPCVWNRGGDLFSEDLNRSTLSKTETVKGLEDYLELAVRGYMPLFGESVFEGGPVFEQDCAMVLGGKPPCRSGRKNVFRPAKIPGKRTKELVLGHNLAVASGSENLKEAGSFLKWACAADNQRAFASGFSVFPCLRQALDDNLDGAIGETVWRSVFSKAALTPNTTVFPTAELLLDRALWRASLKISRSAYLRGDFLRELIIAQGEIDYLLSLY